MSVVVVTGARSGIGLRTVQAFGRRGDSVYATVHDVDRCDELRRAVEVELLPGSVVQLDVTDETAADELIDRIVDIESRIDVLVNNAGIGGPVAAVEEIDEATARAIWETNFWAPMRLIRRVLPGMRAAGQGVIVNLTTFGVRFPGGRGLAMYGASKKALAYLTESIQAEIADTVSGRCRSSLDSSRPRFTTTTNAQHRRYVVLRADGPLGRSCDRRRHPSWR